jgi:hypothetical protein
LTANDNCSGAITVTGVDTNNGGSNCNLVITRTWTFTDACGNSSSVAQTITVKDVIAPVISGVGASATISCPSSPVFSNPTASDNCGSATLSSADVVTKGCGNTYSVTRTWTATDACGNTSTASQTINVQDVTAPVIAALPAPSTISCGSTPVFAQATATDGCGTVTLTSSVQTINDCLKGGYTTTKTWVATDACGNSSTASQTITVVSCEQVTVTQGGWGAKPSGNNWGAYLVKNFSGSVTVGNTANNKYVTLTSVSAIQNFLPNGGTPSALKGAYTNPTSKTVANTLAGQAVTTTLNIRFWPSIKNLVVKSGAFAGTSVQQALDIANRVLGGSTEADPSAINEVLNSINVNFDEGANHGYLVCPSISGKGSDVTTTQAVRDGDNTNPVNDFVAITAYPNPFVDRIKIDFTVEETSNVSLQLFNSSGIHVHTLYNGVAEKGVQYNTEYTSSVPGLYIYRLSTSQGIISGKVIQIK